MVLLVEILTFAVAGLESYGLILLNMPDLHVPADISSYGKA